MATKPFVTVTLGIHDAEETIEIKDYIDANGKFVNIGTQAAAAINRRVAIHYVNADGQEIVIPFHAITSVKFAKEQGTYTPAEDAFCKPVSGGDGDTAVVGNAIVGTSTVGE